MLFDFYYNAKIIHIAVKCNSFPTECDLFPTNQKNDSLGIHQFFRREKCKNGWAETQIPIAKAEWVISHIKKEGGMEAEIIKDDTVKR